MILLVTGLGVYPGALLMLNAEPDSRANLGFQQVVHNRNNALQKGIEDSLDAARKTCPMSRLGTAIPSTFRRWTLRRSRYAMAFRDVKPWLTLLGTVQPPPLGNRYPTIAIIRMDDQDA